MTREKQESLYIAMLTYAHHAYVNQQKRDDDVYKLMCRINKIAERLKPRKAVNQQIVKYWFDKYIELDASIYEKENKLYAPEINMIVILYYLVGEHRFADLIAKYTLDYIRAVHHEIETEHRELTMEAWDLLDKFEKEK